MTTGKFRKALGVALAAALAMAGMGAFAGTANAAGTVVTDPDVTFTFTGSSDQLEQANLTAYKIADFVQYGTGSSAKYGVQTAADNKTAVQTALGTATSGQADPYDSGTDGDPMVWALSQTPAVLGVDDADWGYESGTASSVVRKFANALAGSGPTAVTADFVEHTSGDQVTSLTVSLDPGVYLFIDSAAGTSNITTSVPMILSSGSVSSGTITSPIGGNYTTAGIKSVESSDQSKQVTETSASIGDTLHYTLQGTIGNASTTTFQFVDTPGVGLTVNLPTSVETATSMNFIVTSYDGVDGQGKPTGTGSALTYGTGYTITTSGLTGNMGNGTGTFTVSITNPGSLAGKTIVVAYTATVNDQAVVDSAGGTVVNTLANNGDPITVTTPLRAFQFTKKNADGAVLSGAQFTVKRDGNVLSFVKQSDGTYRKATSSSTQGATSTLESGNDGLIVVTGLSAGDYVVTETKVPDGYQSILPEFTVRISDGGTVSIATADTWGLAQQDTVTGAISVLNVRSITELPMTGAAGTILFTVLGLLIAGAGVTMYMRSRSMHSALRG